jgi:hypothetical protein
MQKLLDAVLAKRRNKPLVSEPKAVQKERRLGRPPALDDAELLHRRDQLQGIFAAHWPIIGWNLQHARKPLHITDALRPLASLNHPTIDLLLLDSFKKPMPDGFLLLQQKRKSLHRRLAEAQNGHVEANAKVIEATAALERARNEFAIACDGYALARKKRKATDSFRNGRKKWSRLYKSVRTELNRREKNLIESAEEIGRMEKEIAEIGAHFAQTELLRFVLSDRYAFTPINFANAAAGLPQMGWRRSALLCSRIECFSMPSVNYLIFDAVRIILEEVSPASAEEAAREIRRQISKRSRFESIREFLGQDWPALERAVLAVWHSSIHAGVRPYRIASMFLDALKAPRNVVNPLLDKLQNGLPPT